MKRNENVEDILKESLPSASSDEAESARGRVFSRLREGSAGDLREDLVNFTPPRALSRRWLPAAAAAALLIGAIWAIWGGFAWQELRGYAVLETAEASTKIAPREIVRSVDRPGMTLKLADGSRVEMRTQSELSWEPGDDGVRIRLNSGSIIVNAARQRSGHFYVQTKDVTVSVVGTVFFVNAEAEGSRVAVIEGEVRVQSGAAEQKLRRGEQLTTAPSLETRPLKEEISWSQNAPTHVAQLQQPASATSAQSASVTGVVRTAAGAPAPGVRVTAISSEANPENGTFRALSRIAVTEVSGRYRLEDVLPGTYTIIAGYSGTREISKGSVLSVSAGSNISDVDFVLAESARRFEETSVRRSNAIAGAGERGQGGTVAVIKGCTNPPRIDPQQFVAINTTVYNLISFATGYSCSYLTSVDLVEGGPGWIKSDLYDVRGLMPKGYSRDNLPIPEVQAMVLALLEDRFGLVMRREMQQRSYYELRLGNTPHKLTPWKEGDKIEVNGNPILTPTGPATSHLGIHWMPDPVAGESFTLVGRNVAMGEAVGWIARAINARVVDRTGLKGKFSFDVEYSKDGVARPQLPAAIQEKLGLRLENTKGPMEVFVIDRAERPTEN